MIWANALSRGPRTQSADEDMALALQEVLGTSQLLRRRKSKPSAKGEPAGPVPTNVAPGEPLKLSQDTDSEAIGFRGPTACTAAEITYRQLDYWARTGLVQPSMRAASDPESRLYGFRDIMALKITKRLLGARISVREIRRVVKYLQDGEDYERVTVLSAGTILHPFIDLGPDVLKAMISDTPDAVAISLRIIAEEVRTALAAIPGEGAVQAQAGPHAGDTPKRRGRRAG